MKNRLLVSVIALEVVLAGTFGLLRYRAFEAAAHAPITLGFIEPLSGDMAAAGLEDKQAKQLAIDELNKAGGIDGHPIVAVWNDGKCDATTAILAARELVDGGVAAVLTGPCTAETLAAASVTQPARIPLIASTSPGKAVSFAGDLVYRMTYSDATEGKMVAGYLEKKRAMKSVVVLSGESEAEKQRRDGFVRERSTDGMVILLDESVASINQVTPSLLASIRRAKPEAIYLNVDDPSVAERLVKEFGWYGIKVPVVVTGKSGQWDGVLVSGENMVSTNPAATAFIDGYRAVYDLPVDPGAAAHAYDSIYVLADVIEHVGTDAMDIRSYLDDPGHSWETSVGTTRFDQNGDASYGIYVGGTESNDSYTP